MADSDFDAREKIRKDVGHNFFVEAGAGSGKTSVLVDRMVSMVEAGIDISKICAITFTKTAAGEFYARFQKKLSKSSSPNAKRALNDIDLCFMGTIDAFCNMVISEYPMEVGVPSNVTVIDKKEQGQLLKEEYSKILRGEAGSALKSKAASCMDFCWDLKQVFLSAMPELLEHRNAKLNYTAPKATKPDAFFAAEKKELVRFLESLREHPELEYEKNADSKKSWEILQNSWDVISGSWDKDLNSVIKSLSGLKDLRVISEYDPDTGILGPKFQNYYTEHYKKKKIEWYEVKDPGQKLLTEKLKEFQFSVLTDFLACSVPVVTESLKKQGKLSFTDYLLYLRDMLKEDVKQGGELTKHIGERHSYFLVDEFQDTNPVQAEIIFYLTAEKPEEDWIKCVPRAGSLFIVGDPKQSIYRFQNADVASFKKVKGLFTGKAGEVLELTRNFRSSEGMCDWFNTIFEKLLPEDTDDQSKFKKIPSGGKTTYRGTLEGVYSYKTHNVIKVEDREDPQKAARIIKKIVYDPQYTIQDRDRAPEVGCNPRRAEFKDFMVIVPGKNHLSYYTRKFAEEGIPFKVEGKIVFAECPALVAVVKLLAAVAEPYDQGRVFEARKFGRCDISEEEIHCFAECARSISPVAVLTMLTEEKEIFLHAGVKNAEYLYYATELLRTAETNGQVSSLKEAVEYLGGLIKDDKALERCLQLVREENCVHIANLHKVKGLEKPIVILADPDVSTHKASSRVDYSTNPPESWIFSLSGGNKVTFESFEYENEQQKEENVLAAERIRLLYVAATRAGNALIIADGVTSKGERSKTNPWIPLLESGEAKPFEPETGAEEKADGISGDFNQLYEEAEKDCVLNDRSAEKASCELKRPSLEKLNRVTETEDEYDDAEDEKKKRTGNAAVTGTLVHRLMEVLVTSRNSVDLNAAVKDILSEYGAENDPYEAMLRRVGETVRSGGFAQRTDVPQDILTELLSAEEVHCELPFCFKEGQEIWNGVMDVVYKKGGSWHIVDYKTNAEARGLDQEYENQLEAYKKAFSLIIGNEADAKIYHMDVQG